MQTKSTKTANTSARGNPPDAAATPVWNWTEELVTYPQVVVTARSVDDIVAIVRDRDKYPAPVRAHGSRHTTTACGEADGGTIVDMRAMDYILRIEGDRVTAEAGAKYIDVAKKLKKHNLQFFVNIELGNLSMGAAACTATKDASMPREYGQVNSYCIGLKLVKASGDIVEITENDTEVLQAARSSYGMLGIVYEVTFKVKPLQAMKVKHEVFSVDEFARRLPELIGRGQSIMMYVFPFLNRIVVELRSYVGEEAEVKKRLPASHFIWRLRNGSWKTVVPWLNHILRSMHPSSSVTTS